MKIQPGIRCSIILSLILITMLSCTLTPTITPTPTPTPGQTLSLTPNAGSIGGSSSSDANGNSGGNSSGNGSSSNGGTDGTNNPGDTVSPTSGVTPEVGTEPYVVKQLVSLGHESISGGVCSVTKPFAVSAVAPSVSWAFNFAPLGVDHGNWTYAYVISKAGESHDAKGTYTLTQTSPDGTLLLTMKGSDHVVFKGFDGNFPVSYKFNLVPSQNLTCP